MTAAAVPTAGHRGLLERLLAVVRPEFRVDVFLPERTSSVFYSGVCRVESCTVAVALPAKGLCRGHYTKWRLAARAGEQLEEWLVVEDGRTRERLHRITDIPACAVSGCNRAAKTYRLCHRHAAAYTSRFQQTGRPVEAFVDETVYVPTVQGEHDCRFPGCERWSEGARHQFCRIHEWRWRSRGQPSLEDWLTELGRGADPRIRLDGLLPQVRLEVQYGLQCRHDQARKVTTPTVVTAALGPVRAAGVTSLLDWDETRWREHLLAGSGRAVADGRAAFVLDTHLQLRKLLIADDPWAALYGCSIWDLVLVDRNEVGTRYIDFSPLRQSWLREAVKRWARWRLARGVTAAGVKVHVQAVAELAGWLPAAAGPADLTRDRLEAWLAALQHARPSAYTRSRIIRCVGMFLRDAHRHGWLPDLPRSAVLADDAPKTSRPAPRFIPEHVMRQLERPEQIARFDRPDGRLLLRLLVACGLRLKDARTLPVDCVSRDDTGAPYLVWVNRKMDRTAFFPIAEDLAAAISDQQRHVRERFPAGCGWLFPAHSANLNAATPLSDTYWREHCDRWLRELDLVDEHDRPVRVTAHQFRHTLGTRLINADVPLHIVQQLLDHMSPEMTAIYARIHNSTVRRHWETAVKVNADGRPVQPEPGHPLADAAWHRLSLVRAKVTLPNGYCGAPVQTDCEYANPCLDCRFFITTPDFLAQHRQQRTNTAAAIADAEHAGLVRIAEKNRRTLTKLDTIIAALDPTIEVDTDAEPQELPDAGT